MYLACIILVTFLVVTGVCLWKLSKCYDRDTIEEKRQLETSTLYSRLDVDPNNSHAIVQLAVEMNHTELLKLCVSRMYSSRRLEELKLAYKEKSWKVASAIFQYLRKKDSELECCLNALYNEGTLLNINVSTLTVSENVKERLTLYTAAFLACDDKIRHHNIENLLLYSNWSTTLSVILLISKFHSFEEQFDITFQKMVSKRHKFRYDDNIVLFASTLGNKDTCVEKWMTTARKLEQSS